MCGQADKSVGLLHCHEVSMADMLLLLLQAYHFRIVCKSFTHTLTHTFEHVHTHRQCALTHLSLKSINNKQHYSAYFSHHSVLSESCRFIARMWFRPYGGHQKKKCRGAEKENEHCNIVILSCGRCKHAFQGQRNCLFCGKGVYCITQLT